MSAERSKPSSMPGSSTRFSNTGTSKVRMHFDYQQVIQNLTRNVPMATKLGIAVGFERASAKLLQISKKYVPIGPTKNLINSGSVIRETALGKGRFSTALATTSSVTSDSYTSGIQYGNSKTPYAIYVHEDTDAKHGAAYNRAYDTQLWRGYAGFNHHKRDEEQAKWMDKAMDEGADEVKGILNTHIALSIRRVLKNFNRYGLKTSDLGGVRALSKGAYKSEMGW